MEPIQVPGPPKEAFNKNRRISDLIRAQVNHLKHIEHKLPLNMRQQIPQHAITTEDDAARYIAPITNLLRSQVSSSSTQSIRKIQRPTSIRPGRGFALAASAEAGSGVPGSKEKRSKASLESKTIKKNKGQK